MYDVNLYIIIIVTQGDGFRKEREWEKHRSGTRSQVHCQQFVYFVLQIAVTFWLMSAFVLLKIQRRATAAGVLGDGRCPTSTRPSVINSQLVAANYVVTAFQSSIR